MRNLRLLLPVAFVSCILAGFYWWGMRDGRRSASRDGSVRRGATETPPCYCNEAMGCCWDECPACFVVSGCVAGFDDPEMATGLPEAAGG